MQNPTKFSSQIFFGSNNSSGRCVRGGAEFLRTMRNHSAVVAKFQSSIFFQQFQGQLCWHESGAPRPTRFFPPAPALAEIGMVAARDRRGMVATVARASRARSCVRGFLL